MISAGAEEAEANRNLITRLACKYFITDADSG